MNVSELNNKILNDFRSNPDYRSLSVSGEIFEWRETSKGVFLTLKDYADDAKLPCVIWDAFKSKQQFRPGDSVTLTGFIDFWSKRGELRFNTKHISADTQQKGSALLALKKLTEKLKTEGVFEKKRLIPVFPLKIAVVTSSSGAVIHDIADVFARRNPLAELYIFDTAVQGVNAPFEICSALKKADSYVFSDNKKADVIILARGGGGSADLSAFNSEEVARAVFLCETMVVSAVGHETDFTLADYAADIRAGTPSIAAEMSSRFIIGGAAYTLFGIKSYLEGVNSDVEDVLERKISEYKFRLGNVKSTLSPPEKRISDLNERLKRLSFEINSALDGKIAALKQEIISKQGIIDALSPYNVFKRGFAAVRKEGVLLTDSANAEKGENIEVLLGKGRVFAEITAVFTDEPNF